VLIDLELLLEPELPHRDPMGLGTREVVQGRPEARLGDDVQVYPQARSEPGDAPRGPLGYDRLHVLVLEEALGYGRPFCAGHQDIEVADRLLAAPEAPRDGGPFYTPNPPEVFQHRLGDWLGDVPQERLLGPSSLLDGFQDRLLGLGTEAGELADLSPARGLRELLRRADPEALVQHAHPFRTQSRDGEEICQLRTGSALDLGKCGEAPGLDHLSQLSGELLPDTGKQREIVAGLDHLAQPAL
jgi:hypothetical protein